LNQVSWPDGRDAGKGKVDFVDVALPDYSPQDNQGVTFEMAMGRIHAIMADGSVVTDVEVFRRLYEVRPPRPPLVCLPRPLQRPSPAPLTSQLPTPHIHAPHSPPLPPLCLPKAVGLGWVYAITKVEPIGSIVDRLYSVWAKYRMEVTGREPLAIILEKRRSQEGAKICAPTAAGVQACEAPPSAAQQQQQQQR
jgi:hypothetical protein